MAWQTPGRNQHASKRSFEFACSGCAISQACAADDALLLARVTA